VALLYWYILKSAKQVFVESSRLRSLRQTFFSLQLGISFFIPQYLLVNRLLLTLPTEQLCSCAMNF